MRTLLRDRRAFLGAAAMTLAAAEFGGLRLSGRAGGSGQLTALGGATTWLNSPPRPAAALLGKPTLVQFGTYTCINWLRTLPYVRAWQQRHATELTVITVHTPEFAFEHDLTNVRRALQHLDVDFPVAIDNDYRIWRAFDNHYWPALYLLDARGRIRHRHFGEGGYDESARAIHRLVADTTGAAGTGGAGGTKDRSGDSPIAPVAATGFEVQADWSTLRSPEIYLGYDRGDGLASPGGGSLAKRRAYKVPAQLDLNRWALDGDWTLERQPVRLDSVTGRIVCRFHARDVHLVLGPARRGERVRIRVSLDGRPPGAARGGDVDEHGAGTIAEQRLYQLIRHPGPIVDRTFEIAFLDGGAEAFAFTFG